MSLLDNLKKIWPLKSRELTLMEKYQLLKHPDPSVMSPCLPYDIGSESFDFELADAMRELLVHMRAVSLSANQFGIKKRLSVMAAFPDVRRIMTCFNPRVINRGRRVVEGREGSLSLLGVTAIVRRHAMITVEFFDEHGQKKIIYMRGWPARIFQHEIDQLDGLFIRKCIDTNPNVGTEKKIIIPGA